MAGEQAIVSIIFPVGVLEKLTKIGNLEQSLGDTGIIEKLC